MTAERLRSDVIADNVANANTTRTAEGGPFKRSRVVLRPRTEQPFWRSPFLAGYDGRRASAKASASSDVEKDNAEPKLMYDPTHPDAIKSGPRQGYVEMPNVNIVTEMVDLIAASRAYEANASIVNGSKTMFMKALEIGGR